VFPNRRRPNPASLPLADERTCLLTCLLSNRTRPRCPATLCSRLASEASSSCAWRTRSVLPLSPCLSLGPWSTSACEADQVSIQRIQTAVIGVSGSGRLSWSDIS
jgi:hypothetical protein